jgi:hypothetical protein
MEKIKKRTNEALAMGTTFAIQTFPKATKGRVTSFKNERVLFRKGNYALVSVPNVRGFGKSKRMMVAVDLKTGFTDYPHKYSTGQVVYDNPENFPKYFKQAVEKKLRKRR